MKPTCIYGCIAAVILLASEAAAQTPPAPERMPLFVAKGAFAAFVVTDLDASVRWYESVLGLHEIKRGKSPRVAAETVVLGGHNIFLELIYYTDRVLAKRQIDDTAPMAGPVKTGAIVSPGDFDSLAKHLRDRGAQPGIFVDKEMGVRSFIVRDNDGNLLQFFAPMD
jgi:catechol 2,3-dioxygenase-like lactoylglutathione lyase family enzyme